MSSRSSRRRKARWQPARQPAPRMPRLSLVKATTSGAPGRPRLSLVKSRPLPRRTVRTAVGEGCAYATHAALSAGLPVRALEWQSRPDGSVYQYLPDGTELSHTGEYGALVTVTVTCTHGAVHTGPVASRTGLEAARAAADRCPAAHADIRRLQAIATPSPMERALAGRREAVKTLQNAKGAVANVR